MTKISDAEMHRRLDDLANNFEKAAAIPERMLTPIHYRKTIQALIDLFAAQKHYDEKPGFWRKSKVDWHIANVRPGIERLALVYQASYGPLDEVSSKQFWEILKEQARNVIIEQVKKMG
jgi:hypothetical protein